MNRTNVATRQQKSAYLPIKLDKYYIPYFNNIRIPSIHQLRSNAIVAKVTIVNFCARTTWSILPHIPEVVFQSKWNNMMFWDPSKTILLVHLVAITNEVP